LLKAKRKKTKAACRSRRPRTPKGAQARKTHPRHEPIRIFIPLAKKSLELLLGTHLYAMHWGTTGSRIDEVPEAGERRLQS
jgi:hypothetical protein